MIDTIGARIARLRKQAGMSQAELAKRIHISRSSVQSWECGLNYPSTDNLIALAKHLHVSADYLLDCNLGQTIRLDDYSDSEQALVMRLLQYFDETNTTSDDEKEKE